MEGKNSKLTKEEEEKAKKAKKSRINKEEKRLIAIYSNIPDEIMAVASGLIRRAAYMKITLEDYETDLDEGGYTELFSQSDRLEPYERERPVARLYNAMNKNYQSIMKQLSDLLPKKPTDGGEGNDDKNGDGFEKFIASK